MVDLSANRDEVRTFWTGPPLSQYEILSLKSFVATGARVILYSYESDLVVPDGVELRDANEVLEGPVHEFRHANGEVTLAWHSDFFRSVMLEKFGGWYADLDVICLKHTLPKAPMYFGVMQNPILNSAILRFPPHSPFMIDLVEELRRRIPENINGRSAAAFISIGPMLVTDMVKKHGLEEFVVPKSRAYAVGYAEAVDFLDPDKCEQTLARLAGSDFAHLWNEVWRQLRIPKNLGPPVGSYLDLMFRRYGIEVRERTRLSIEAMRSWVVEQRLIKDIRINLGIEAVDEFTIDSFAYSIQAFGWMPRDHIYNKDYYGISPEQPKRPRYAKTSNPQIVRTFWHGDFIPPYQAMCLRSFANRGHQVEIFTYNERLAQPSFAKLRDAAEVAPQSSIVFPQANGDAINAALFRFSLLNKLGGWWIDPDVVLMSEDLPDCETFFAEPDAFGQIPVSILKCPASHPAASDAMERARQLSLSQLSVDCGGQILTGVLDAAALQSAARTHLGPVSFFNVPDLFNPGRAVALAEACASSNFLHLNDAVWKRAGIPQELAPPQGAYLDTVFAQNVDDIRFPARMSFDHVNRWLRHMYRTEQIERTFTASF